MINQWTNRNCETHEIKENEVRTLYLELHDNGAGQIRMSRSDVVAKNNKFVPVKRGETSMYPI